MADVLTDEIVQLIRDTPVEYGGEMVLRDARAQLCNIVLETRAALRAVLASDDWTDRADARRLLEGTDG